MFFADGLNCSIFDREVFQEVIDGGLSCITVSLGFWEDALESMDALGRFRDVVQENEDLVARSLDLDFIKKENDWVLKKVSDQNEFLGFDQKIIENGSGTAIIWNKWDKSPSESKDFQLINSKIRDMYFLSRKNIDLKRPYLTYLEKENIVKMLNRCKKNVRFDIV